MADLLVAVGARSGAVCALPVAEACKRAGLRCVTVAAGPDCRVETETAFDVELGLTAADARAVTGSPTAATRVEFALEREIGRIDPLAIVSAGADATAAAWARAAAGSGRPVARIEAGLRSGDQRAADESNRRLCDHSATFLYATGEIERDHLLAEGIRADRIEAVGSTVCVRPTVDVGEEKHAPPTATAPEVAGRPYGVVTIAGRDIIDEYEPLRRVLEAVFVLSRHAPLTFPMGEPTRQRLEEFRFLDAVEREEGIHACAPLGWGGFRELLAGARIALTDSGVVQEEATARGVPCLTLRTVTERRITLTEGTNRLVGTDTELIVEEALTALEAGPRPWPVLALWDGLADERIAASLRARLRATAGSGAQAGS